MTLEPIWEADLSTHSYGCRPNRSTYDAMTYIGKRLASSAGQASQWVIEGDIASYFDPALDTPMHHASSRDHGITAAAGDAAPLCELAGKRMFGRLPAFSALNSLSV
jgi:hypothetical protein